MRSIKRICVAPVVAALLAAPIAAVSATAAPESPQVFYESYTSLALCQSLAADLRQADYRISINCVRNAGGKYVLGAYKRV